MNKIIIVAVSILTLFSCSRTGRGRSESQELKSTETLPSQNKNGVSNENEEVIREFTPKEFTTLSVNLPVDVVYAQGEAKVRVVSKAKYADHIAVRQGSDGNVVIESDDRRVRFWKGTKIYISSEYLDELNLNGALEFQCNSQIRSRNRFSLNLNGSNDVDILGIETNCSMFTCNGSADLKVHSLNSSIVGIRINGSGDMSISGISAESIEAKVNGSGDVTLEGETATAYIDIKGSGNIDASRLKTESIRYSSKGFGKIKLSEAK